VEEPEQKKVLVYDGRSVYAQSVCWSLENLGVPYIKAETSEEFADALQEEWYYIFSGYSLYEEIKLLMDKTVFPGGKKPPLALMVEWGNEAYISNVRFISIPVQSLSIANVLNGNTDSRSYFSAQNSDLIRFTYPQARLLVVDDISTNLRVAEGLLAPYHAKIDTCLSGASAIELVKQHEYDIVFMDHMMPDMDGIEATRVIRAWEAEAIKNEQLTINNEKGARRSAVPIIALTANAISGMKEMFIEEGFSDFLAKPIDISKLDEILSRWIPKKKRGKSNEQLTMNNERSLDSSFHCSLINGVDIQCGISMTGGTVELYRQVIDIFCKDVEERLPVLHNVLQHVNVLHVPDTSVLSGFITHVHALKSASASIGAAEVSAKAARLEAAGKAADIDFIRDHLPGFADNLAELIKDIRAWESTVKEESSPNVDGTYSHNDAAVMPLLQELAVMLENGKAGDIRRLLRELDQKPCDEKTKKALEQISDNVLMTEFDSALKIVEELVAANN
jgi:CheY-like chemotaxis protein